MSALEVILQCSVATFLNTIFRQLQAKGVDVSGYFCDHMCYRVATVEEYKSLKDQLATVADLLREEMIGGRPIATYKLQVPIGYDGGPFADGNRSIPLLELPSPKPGSSYASGLEHVEFVIPDSLDKFTASYPDFAWDMKGAQKALNADVRLALAGDISVKFHNQSLEEVVEYEKQLAARG